MAYTAKITVELRRAALVGSGKPHKEYKGSAACLHIPHVFRKEAAARASSNPPRPTLRGLAQRRPGRRKLSSWPEGSALLLPASTYIVAKERSNNSTLLELRAGALDVIARP